MQKCFWRKPSQKLEFSGKFLAGGTQKLELLGFLRWRRPEVGTSGDFLARRCPEIGISGAFCWRQIQKQALLGVASCDGVQKLELLDMLLLLGGPEVSTSGDCDFWKLKYQKYQNLYEKAGFEPVPSKRNARCLYHLSQPVLVLDI